MSKLSVVLPAYNEELMVGKTCRVLAEVLTKAKIPYELVVVNDGSGDRTWEEIQKAGERDANVTGVLFSRNFGKEAAIFAGLAQACGDVVAVMDCDLQHPPEILLEMYRLWKQGYEVVEGIKKNRGKETLFPGGVSGQSPESSFPYFFKEMGPRLGSHRFCLSNGLKKTLFGVI